MKTIALIIAMITARAATAIADPTPTPEDLFTAGQTAFDHTDYTTAIARWQASYQLSGASVLLFNIAQALRLSGDCAGALATYQRFDADDPDTTSDQHKIAQDFERELKSTCAARPVPVVVEPPKLVGAINLVDRLSHHESDASEQPGRTLKIASYTAGGAGVAALTAGIFLGHHASTLGNDVTRACATSCDWSVQQGNDAAGRRDASIGYALDGLGAAAIAGSAVMYYLGNRESAVIISPRPREGGAVVSWSGSW